MNPEARHLFITAAQEVGVDVTPHLDRFARLLTLLVEGNAQTNLTAITEERDVVLKHYIDSLTCLRSGRLTDGAHVVDIGTGAGFPALPLAIVCPAVRFVPLDATRKKVEFVRRAALDLGLTNVEPTVGRAETLGRDPSRRGTFDVAVTRAVSALNVLVELGLPLLREGGVLIAQKGQAADEEIEGAHGALKLVGGEVEEIVRGTLPSTGEARHLVIVRKIGPTPETYPRREGVPNKYPLS